MPVWPRVYGRCIVSQLVQRDHALIPDSINILLTDEAATRSRSFLNSPTMRFGRKAKGRLELNAGEPPPEPKLPEGRVPRISKLMALAIRVDELVRAGEIADYAEAARLAQVTRARTTQIMNLLNLAPEIQEELLLLPPTVQGCDPISEKELRAIASEVTWLSQSLAWGAL